MARRYTKYGWAVFPLHYPVDGECSCGYLECTSIGKHPLTPNGAKDASIDRKQINDWWEQYPEANIGLNAGKSGLVMIDIDPYHGGNLRDLPLTRMGQFTTTVSTGGGGRHLLYEAPVDLQISNSNKRCPQGIDIRAGDGAYTVVPPSRHASGRLYRFVRGREPWTVAPLPLPASLLPILTIKNYPQEDEEAQPATELPDISDTQQRHPYIQAALHQELNRLTQAREGNRNSTLNEGAFNLGQFVGAGLLPRAEVEQLLTQTALAIGLGETETHRTIRSGLEAGMQTPRQNWPKDIFRR